MKKILHLTFLLLILSQFHSFAQTHKVIDTLGYVRIKQESFGPNGNNGYYSTILEKAFNDIASQAFLLDEGTSININGVEVIGENKKTSAINVRVSIYAVNSNFVPTTKLGEVSRAISNNTNIHYFNFATPITVRGNYAVLIEPTSANAEFHPYVTSISMPVRYVENYSKFHTSYNNINQFLSVSDYLARTGAGNYNNVDFAVAPIIDYEVTTGIPIVPTTPVCFRDSVSLTGTSGQESFLNNRMMSYIAFTNYFGANQSANNHYEWKLSENKSINNRTINHLFDTPGEHEVRYLTYYGIWNYTIIDTPATVNIFQNDIPTVSSAPQDKLVRIGQDATFSLTVPNATTFQWQKKTGTDYQNISEGSEYSGVNTGTLTVKSVTQAMDSTVFRCVFSGNCTKDSSTSDVVLSVVDKLTITFDPPSSIAYGSQTTIDLATSNSDLPLTYQSNNDSVIAFINGTLKIIGAGTATITVNQSGVSPYEDAESVVRTITIQKKPVTVIFNYPFPYSKIYDGLMVNEIPNKYFSILTTFEGEEVTVSGSISTTQSSVGNNIPATISSLQLGGAHKNNYEITTTSIETNISIEKKTIEATIDPEITITKTYDGNNTAILKATDYILADLIPGDQVTVSGTAIYNNHQADNNKTVAISSLQLSGIHKNNYQLSSTTTTATGSITKKSITISLNAAPLITKEYNGNSTATLISSNYVLNGLILGDAVSVSGSATYQNALIGQEKTITVTNLTLEGADKTNYSLANSSANTTGAITQKTITVSFHATPAITKEYDGNNTAVIPASKMMINGIVGSEKISIEGTAVYKSKDAASNISIDLNGIQIKGTHAANYKITNTTLQTTGAITPKLIDVNISSSPAISKKYDGTKVATLASTSYVLTDIINNDDVQATGTANYADKNVGTNKLIEVSNLQLSGSHQNNYRLRNTTASTTGAITAQILTVSLQASPAITKIYNGNNSATLLNNNYIITGILDADQVSITSSATYQNAQAGVQKNVTATNFSLHGADKNNYTISTISANTTGTITPKPISVTAKTSPEISKVYNGNREASLTASNYTLSDVILNDEVTVSGTAVYNNAQAGDSKSITITSLQLGGAQKNNYTLTQTSTTTTGKITPKVIEASINPSLIVSKVFDGLTTANIAQDQILINGKVGNDDIYVEGTAAYNNKNANPSVVVHYNNAQIKGADAANYRLSGTPISIIGKILKKPITVTANPATKVYGTTDPIFTFSSTNTVTNEPLTGNLSRVAGKNTGTYAIEIGTVGGANYEVTTFNSALLTITPANLEIIAEDKTKKQGENNPNFTLRYHGWVAGENENDLIRAPKVTTTATSLSPIGYFPITIAEAASNNYNIVVKHGRLTILPGDEKQMKAWTSGRNIQVRIYSTINETAGLMLVAANGNNSLNQRIQLTPGVNSFEFPIGTRTKGIYYLKLVSSKGIETIGIHIIQ